MNRYFVSSIIVLFAGLSGCVAAPAEETTGASSEEVIAAVPLSAMKALPPGATHLYFSNPVDAYVTDDVPLAYRWFTANAGSEFKVSVSDVDGSGVALPGTNVGFKLQRAVQKNGKWQWSVVRQADSDTGIAALKYTPKNGVGLYLVTATASPLPATLRVNLACGSNGCATALQPGDACGGRTISHKGCDAGTYCAYTLAEQCGAADQQGVCAVEPTICPRGIRYNPMCGCDGNTYDGGCNAAAAGVSVQRVGACDQDVTGGWGYINGAHYDYTFNPDGTFTAMAQPACAFSTPRCMIRLALTNGSYMLAGTSLFLTYTSAYRNGETATFAITKSSGKVHLLGTDFGAKLDLTHTK